MTETNGDSAVTEPAADKIETWAIIELFGHQKLAGKVSEHQMGGSVMLRVDVPAAPGSAAFTRFIGPSAVFSLTPVSEEVARLAASRVRAAPVTIYAPELQPRALAAGSPVESDDPDDY